MFTDDLWSVPTAVDEPREETRDGELGPDAFVPRPYQMEDISAARAAWQAARAVLYRAATGLGKATVLATIAATCFSESRTLCVVNTVKLANQLRETFARQLGWRPGLIGGGRFDGTHKRVVIAVIQSLYSSGRDGQSRVERTFDPEDFGLVLIDECEGALAEKYAGVIRYFLNGNPDLKVLGCTATPIRGDGVGMGALFDHIEEREDFPLNRGPLWAFQQGYLVPPRQKFVKVSADFAKLTVRKRDDGEADYSDEQIGRLLADEKHLIEMASGIVAAAGTERCIVICPNSTETCDAVAEYLNAQRPGCARAVHGNKKTCPNPDDVFEAHRRGEFQFLCGVNMLTTGYDDPAVRSVFILRPTRSQRLFTQIIGRAFRPHGTIARELGELSEPAERRALIANSPKPHCNVYCLVGVSRDTRDMTIADMIRGRLTDAELERVKQKMLDGVDDEQGDGEAAPERSVAELVKEVRQEIADEKAATERRRLELKQATVSIRDMDAAEGEGLHPGARKGAYETLRQLGYKPGELDRMSAAEAGEKARWEMARKFAKPPMSSKGQRNVLIGRGLSKAEAEGMSKATATRVLDAVSKAERWNTGERGARLPAVRVREIIAAVNSTPAERGVA